MNEPCFRFMLIRDYIYIFQFYINYCSFCKKVLIFEAKEIGAFSKND